MAKPYKKPDLNAPRYRPKKLNFTNIDFHERFVKDNSRFNSISLDKFKKVISDFNEKIWLTAIEERDGVELPEQLGFIFIGTCPRKKSNVDFGKSIQHGVVLQHQNWDSDNYMAKIFYTNYETKYRFKHNDLWGFTGLRNFRRHVAKTYPVEWKKYVMVDNLVRVSRIFRKQRFKQYKEDLTQQLLEEYDEFNLEQPWPELP